MNKFDYNMHYKKIESVSILIYQVNHRVMKHRFSIFESRNKKSIEIDT